MTHSPTAFLSQLYRHKKKTEFGAWFLTKETVVSSIHEEDAQFYSKSSWQRMNLFASINYVHESHPENRVR